MGGEVEDFFPIVKGGLRAVSMMYIKVDDQHTGKLELLQSIGCPNGDIAEETKPHCPFRLGVMTGWANKSKAVLDLTREQGIDHFQDTSNSIQGDLVASGTGYGVRIQLSRGLAGGPLNIPNMRKWVDEIEFAVASRARL